jgi:hypothetical protein
MRTSLDVEGTSPDGVSRGYSKIARESRKQGLEDKKKAAYLLGRQMMKWFQLFVTLRGSVDIVSRQSSVDGSRAPPQLEVTICDFKFKNS